MASLVPVPPTTISVSALAKRMPLSASAGMLTPEDDATGPPLLAASFSV